MKRVQVKWIDSAGPSRYWNPDIELHADPVVTVGFLHKRTKKELVIIQSQASESLGGFLVIPMSAVRRIKKLK